jgi:sodium transport system permease protein
LVYALAAITVAARIFGAEAVLFSEQSSWANLFRRSAKARANATVSGALLCLALLIPASFVAMHLVGQVGANSRLTYQVAATLLLFVGMPLLGCLIARIRVVSALQLTLPPVRAWPAALLLAGAAVPAMYQIIGWMRDWGLLVLTPQLEQQLFRALMPWGRASSLSFGAVIGTFVLIAVTEEVLFRGFLFSALRARVGPRATIVVSALLFGVFHGVSLIDRLLPSTLMGLLLGWVCWQTRSVLPGMLLHGSYNALLLLLSFYEADPGGTEEFRDLLKWWQLAALPAGVIGVALLWRSPPGPERQ